MPLVRRILVIFLLILIRPLSLILLALAAQALELELELELAQAREPAQALEPAQAQERERERELAQALAQALAPAPALAQERALAREREPEREQALELELELELAQAPEQALAPERAQGQALPVILSFHLPMTASIGLGRLGQMQVRVKKLLMSCGILIALDLLILGRSQTHILRRKGLGGLRTRRSMSQIGPRVVLTPRRELLAGPARALLPRRVGRMLWATMMIVTTRMFTGIRKFALPRMGLGDGVSGRLILLIPPWR